MAHHRLPGYAPLLALLVLPIAAGCGSSADVPVDTPPDDSGDSSTKDTSADPDTGTPPDTATSPDTGPLPDTATPPDTYVDPDTGPADLGPPDAAPKDCSTVALATDPSSSLDPLADGPLKVAHTTVTVPTLGPLTSVSVKITYPVKSDGVTPDPGRHAWVMFQHAVHGPYPGVTYDRYDGIFDRWASHGIIVFSIDSSKVYFPPPPCPAGTIASGAGCFTYLSWPQQKVVAGMMDEAITYFVKEQEKSTFPLQCALDLSRVGVSGHSRGGGSALLVTTARTDGVTIKGYVGFQPVNPEVLAGAPAPAPVPLYDLPALWLDSGNDGDVTYPTTAMLFSDTRFKATHATILGSKHTYTLDTPYPDQGGPAATITPDEHKRVCHFYSVPFLRAYVRDATAAAADLDAVAGPGGLVVPATVSTGNATVRWHLPNSYAYLEKFDEALGTTPLTTVAGGTITLTGGMTAVSYETYVTSTSGWGATGVAVSRLLRSVKLNWGTTDAVMELPLPAGALASKKAIVFETAFLDSPTATSGTHPLYLELTDTTGATSSIAISTLVPASWSLRPRRLSEAYVPLTKFTGVDLTKAKSIRFVAKAGTTNHDILIDLLRVE